jgi:uncharacterized protein involved in exopolysaccharide biosynthesis
MEKIYLRDALGQLWAARFFMLFSVIAGLLIAFVLLVNTPPQYEAMVTLVPTRANQYAGNGGGSGSSIVGSIAGQFLGMGNDKDTQSTGQFVELMQSPFIVGLIDRRDHIIQHIFASQWNGDTKQWAKPAGLTVDIKNAIKSMLHRPLWVAPGAYDASAQLALRTTVDISPQTGMVHLTFRDKDPAYAAFLLNAMYAATDGLLRERAKQRSDEHIAYIQRQLSSVNNAENRQSLATLLTAELGQQLLINSNAPFVLEKLGPTIVSPTPVSPKIFVYIVAGIFCGAGIGFGLFLLNSSTMLLEKLRDQLRARLGRK